MAGLILRMSGLAVCAGAWWWLSARGQAEGIPGGLPLVLAAHGALVVGAVLLARPLAGWIGDFTANFFMPGERHARPQPMYSIPEGRMAREDYAGALEAYAELASRHPGEIAPHLRMMEIRLRIYRDAESARIIRAGALVSIKGKKNRANFDRASRVLLAEAGVET